MNYKFKTNIKRMEGFKRRKYEIYKMGNNSLLCTRTRIAIFIYDHALTF